MKYFYKIAYGWYDESSEEEFWSATKYSQNEFEAIIRDLVKRAVDILIQKKQGWIGASSIAKEVCELLPEKGFHLMEYDAEHHIVGTGIYMNDYGPDDNWFDEMMDRETRERAIQFNNDFEIYLDEDFNRRHPRS